MNTRITSLLYSLIFKFKIRYSIKKKSKKVRLLVINLIQQRIFSKIKSNLTFFINSVRNIQRFCIWYNKFTQINIVNLNTKFDNCMLAFAKVSLILTTKVK